MGIFSRGRLFLGMIGALAVIAVGSTAHAQTTPGSGVTLKPFSGSVQAGKTLRLYGTGFSSPNTVKIGSVEFPGKGLLSTYFPLIVPKTFVPGTYQVTVTNKNGVSNAQPVTITAPATGGGGGGGSNQTIELTSVTPSIVAGKKIAVRGKGFSYPNKVTLTGPTTVTLPDAGLLSTFFYARTSKTLAAGTYMVMVKNKQGLVSNALPITVTAAPNGGGSGGNTYPVSVTSVTTNPSPIVKAKNASVKVKGSGFFGPNEVTLTGPITKTYSKLGLLPTQFSFTVVKNDLPAGTYTLKVKNKYGEVSKETPTITVTE